MNFPVKKNEINRFDKLYHTMLGQNLAPETSYPRELKDLSTLDISVINIVASKPDIIIREIAEYLKLPNSTLTSSINRLESKGIAKRIISPRDRRSFSLELTERGFKIQQAHLDFEKAFFESVLARLHTHEERNAFMDLLDKIVNGYPEDNKTNPSTSI